MKARADLLLCLIAGGRIDMGTVIFILAIIVATCWFGTSFFFYVLENKAKKANPKTFIHFKPKNMNKIVIVFVLFFACCSPGKMVNTGYLVMTEQGRMIKWNRVESIAQVDTFILDKTGLKLNTANLIGAHLPYFEFMNGDFSIYVEEQGIYQRREKGKKRWRAY
jgi:hypothetical protein